MAGELEQFIQDCRDAIRLNEGDEARAIIKQKLAALTANDEFVQKYCGADAKVGDHILHKDPELGFMVLNHVKDYERTQPPHDHGDSWAMYSQAVGSTEISEYERVDDLSKKGYADVRKVRDFLLERGMVGCYGPREIHSIHYMPGVRFIRIVGNDFTLVSQRVFDLERKTVTITDPTRLPSRI